MSQLIEKFMGLGSVFSVQKILKSMGFELTEEGDFKDTVLPNVHPPSKEWNLIFEVFDNSESRNDLNKLCRNPSTHSSNNEKVICLKAISGIRLTQNSFAHTFEWYVGNLLVRKFAALSSSYGIKISNIQDNSTKNDSGDFDSLVVMRNLRLLYIECKTGSCDAEKIKKARERGLSIHSEATIFVFARAICENTLKTQLKYVLDSSSESVPLQKIKLNANQPVIEIYKFYECYFISAEKSIEEQIKIVLRLFQFNEVELTRANYLRPDQYSKIGYSCFEISLVDTPNGT